MSDTEHGINPMVELMRENIKIAPPRGELAVLLDTIEVFIRRYVVVEESQATALALWVVHTWAIEAAHATPYLFISSAEAESGKTRLMEVLHEIVRVPLLTMNISDAALFRVLDATKPTVFFDEVDAIFNPKARERGVREDLRALLNAGYRRGQLVYRMGGGNRTTLETFAVFGAKALAGLGTLPPTLASRCISIEMKRRRLTEPVEDFFPGDVAEEAARLRDRLEQWAEAHIDELQVARPTRVEGIRDRTMEVWRPLFAIAELDGEPWSARARRAVITLTTDSDDEPSLGLLLLEDIRAVLEPEPPEVGASRPEPLEVIATATLVRALARAEESPWGEWWLDPKTKDPNTQAPRRLAQLLRPYKIRSQKVRIGETTAQGYRREKLVDAWERFLLPRHSGTSGTSGTSQAQSQESSGTFSECSGTSGTSGPEGDEAECSGTEKLSGTFQPLNQANVPHVPDVPHTREQTEWLARDGEWKRFDTDPPAFPSEVVDTRDDDAFADFSPYEADDEIPF